MCYWTIEKCLKPAFELLSIESLSTINKRMVECLQLTTFNWYELNSVRGKDFVGRGDR